MDGNINTILQANQRVRARLEEFFENPDKFELEILTQFLFYRSFSLFQCDHSLASDFWYKVNNEIVARYGESGFNKFTSLRDKRFKEYDCIYDLFINTDLMRNGKPSKQESEIEIIAMWGRTVLLNFGINFIDLDFKKIFQFPAICKTVHAIHFLGIVGKI